MKNKAFVLWSVVLTGLAFAAAWYFTREEKTEDTAPPAFVLEALHRADSYSIGPATARVKVVEFFDPECEACRAVHPMVKQILAEYQGNIQLIYRYMPFHGNSLYAASVLEEARAQGKYDQAMDVLFEKQPEWGDHHQPRPELIPGYMKAIGVDLKSMDKDALIAKHRSIVDRDQADAFRVLVKATPTFYVNGRMVFDLGYEPLKAAIDRALTEK